MRLKKNYNNNNYDKRSYSIKDNEQSGKVNWWFNELDSLGIKNNNDIGVVSNDKSSSSNKTNQYQVKNLKILQMT
jgi:hypothetical protein